ncbi:MAG: SHOCT domain-containing protein [Spirochaetales bacterium]|nr:SHOCT domain-containing protein [Spirochaetales bacterium]
MVGLRLYGAYSWLFWAIVILFVASIVLSIIAIVRTSKHKNYSSSSEVLEALNVRYAKGEISKEEYEAIKKDLK